MKKWKSIDAFEQEMLKDATFREAHEELEPQYRIAREILASRASMGMSQQTLARALGTSQSRISKWESGEELPRLDSLQRIANATGATLHLTLEPGSGDANAQLARTRKSTGRKSAAARAVAGRSGTSSSAGRRKSTQKGTGTKSAAARAAGHRRAARKRG